jgi:hypothetical protein
VCYESSVRAMVLALEETMVVLLEKVLVQALEQHLE